MKERPILFSGPMVRALLAGRKTQTRRALKPQPPAECSIHYMLGNESWLPADERTPLRHHWEAWGGPLYEARPAKALAGSFEVRCPYGAPGDRLYVRETWKPHSTFAGLKPRDVPKSRIFYQADDAYAPSNTPWKPGIHMPRWASRLTLEITEVRVERLQDCSERDARAEGLQVKDAEWMPSYRGADDLPWRPEFPRDAYFDLWDHINGEGAAAANPWVWAVSFRVLEQGA